MTIQFQPFTAAHIAAIQAAGNIGNPMEGFARGQEQYRKNQEAQAEQNRLLAQQEAAQLYAQGDEKGAMNRLLSVAEPAAALQYSLGQERIGVEREQARAQAAQQQIENRQRQEQIDISRQGLQTWDRQKAGAYRQYAQPYLEQGQQPPLSPDQWASQMDPATQGALDQSMGYGAPGQNGPRTGQGAVAGYPQGGPGGAALGEIYKPPQQPPGPPGGQQPPPPPVQQPQPAPIAPGMEPQMGNADLPAVPGVTGPPAGTTPPQARAQAVGPVVQPPAPPQGGAADNYLDTWRREQARRYAIARQGGANRDELLKIATEAPPPRPGVPPQQQMEFERSQQWENQNKAFSTLVDGYTSFKSAYQQYQEAKATGGELGPAINAMIYAAVKANDPQGAVLGGDVKLQADAASVIAQYKNIYPQYSQGGTLPEEVIASMRKVVEGKYAAGFQNYQTIEKQLRDQDQALGLDPYRSRPDLTRGVRPGAPGQGNDQAEFENFLRARAREKIRQQLGVQ